ncbi:outer membrane protein transport protein [Tritonibacter mobilis]|uniref:outer membrane protein transport protein n=1 Tax=Tritonibacter mobilis TaxID=379347 RepID=UPI0014040259|nr:outer membrane protein transport protein [Tritonibacter mobilis]NHM19192.1 aromatic hydrocarbon degradation protein [Tritonibacter mobilis]NHM23344.1 aromatic hydrocarbon degradation protein [Tritonibacter mobilis]
MKHYIAASVATTLLASSAMASGLDRTGQPIGLIFEEGTYAEFSFATTDVELSGNDSTSLNPFGSASGDVGERFNMLSGGFKTDITEELSLAIIYDQPWGVDVNYAVGGSALLGGTMAQADSNAITALLRYKINDRFSVHGGLRYQEIDGEINLAGGAYVAAGLPGGTYNVKVNRDGAFGWVAGVAYEIPEIALRAALTYNSEITHNFVTNESYSPTVPTTTETKTPQSINLDFQTGVAKDTIAFANIRWAEHSVTDLKPTVFGRDLIDLDDSFTYTIGVGHRFNDNWSASLAYIYEDADGDNLVSPLAPTHGMEAIRLGVQYQTEKMKVAAGVRYTKLGDAVAAPGGTPVTNFNDNDALSLAVKVGFYF